MYLYFTYFINLKHSYNISHIMDSKIIKYEYDIKNILSNYIFEKDSENIYSKKSIKNDNDKLNQKAFIKKFLTARSLYDLQNIINPSSKYKKNYLVFDSKNRVRTNRLTHYSWRYAETANNEIGFVNSIGTIENIVSMKLQQVAFGYTVPSYGDYVNSYFNNNRISIFINEFYSQSFISDADTNYHWILRWKKAVDTGYYNTNKSVILQTEHFNDGIYNFIKPIIKLDTLTFSFADPVNTIQLYPDRIKIKFNWTASTNATLNYIYVDPASNPELPSFLGDPLNLAPYDDTMIFITGFTTATPTNANDTRLISFMNSPFGLQIISVTNNQFTVNIPTSALSLTVNPILDIECDAYFALSRFILPIEFTYFTT